MERSGPLGRLSQSWGIVVNKDGGQYGPYVLRNIYIYIYIYIYIFYLSLSLSLSLSHNNNNNNDNKWNWENLN